MKMAAQLLVSTTRRSPAPPARAHAASTASVPFTAGATKNASPSSAARAVTIKGHAVWNTTQQPAMAGSNAAPSPSRSASKRASRSAAPGSAVRWDAFASARTVPFTRRPRASSVATNSEAMKPEAPVTQTRSPGLSITT